MKLLPALVIANTLQWSFGKLRRIEQRPARQIQEYNANSSPSSSGSGESSTAHADSDVGVLSIKEHQENAIRHLQQTECAEFVDCVDGFVKDDPAVTCKYACGVPQNFSTGGECCNRDSNDDGDACEGFTGQVCKDKDELAGFPGSCSGNDACKNANIVSVFKSCTGLRSCEDAGSDNGPSGNEGYVGELVDSCVGTASCLGMASDGGFVGKVTSSCSASQACAIAAGYAYLSGSSYGGGGTIVGIYNSCNAVQACKLLGSKNGTVGIVADSCGESNACKTAAYENGFIGLIDNSCNNPQSCLEAAYVGGAVQEIVNSCNAEGACEDVTNPQQTQRMLAKKPKPPKTPNPNKPPAPAPKPANPNKPAPKPANPNKPAPGPTLPVPDGALCLIDCCSSTPDVCANADTQANLVTKGGCPAECSV